MANFEQAIKRTLYYEGGYSKDPNDKGNWGTVNGKKVLIGTMRGISVASYENYYRVTPTVEQMKALTEADVMPIYKKDYWDWAFIGELTNQSIAEQYLDFVVGSKNWCMMKAADVLRVFGYKIRPLGKETVTPTDRKQIIDYINDLCSKGQSKAFYDAFRARRKLFYETGTMTAIQKQSWHTRTDKHQYADNSEKKN